VWLRGAAPPLVIAYLVGTNVLALVPPLGSVATLLCRSVVDRGGHHVPQRSYLRTARRCALAGAGAALLGLAMFR
jgi:Na+/H+ antiporter NhaD/arsenite permease-like protein